MALINCKECNQKISNKANTICPNCGFKNKKDSFSMGCFPTILLLIFGFLILVYYLGSDDYSSTNTNVISDERTYSSSWRSPQGTEYRDIGKILVANHIKVCGEYHVKEIETKEYIIACTPDGYTWSYYVVYTRLDKVYKANDEMLSQLNPPR